MPSPVGPVPTPDDSMSLPVGPVSVPADAVSLPVSLLYLLLPIQFPHSGPVLSQVTGLPVFS